MPPLPARRIIDARLRNFYDNQDAREFRKAIKLLAEFYSIKRPKIEFYDQLANPKWAGETLEEGTIRLINPEAWKKHRKYNSPLRWLRVVYHEFAHYLLWCDAETKAEAFELRFVKGLR